ncbi:tetratricopeptide repeat protein [bacterium]|nr:tetratricopeptide repeat protein [bacterium]
MAGADAKYEAAIEGLSAYDMTWPQADTLALLCYSNRAMCHLKLGRPELALQLCETGLALPSAVGNSAVTAKLLARKAQACIESDPPRHEDAAEVLCDARSRGLWTKPMAAKFSALSKLLATPLPAPKPLPNGCPGHMPLKLAITEMLNQLPLKNMTSDDLVQFYGGLLHDHIMEPAHVCGEQSQFKCNSPVFTDGGESCLSVRLVRLAANDPEEGGTLMWALCFALSDLGGDARTFCRLLKLFVTEFGLSPPALHFH